MSKNKPPNSTSQPDATEDGDGNNESLTTILTPSQCTDLTLLLAHITESMRQLILDNFSATATLDPTLLGTDDTTSSMTSDEKLLAADPSISAERIDAERKKQELYEKDLSTLKMTNLKKNSLKNFDEWRESVLSRVGEAVNSPDTARRQLQKSPQPGADQDSKNSPSIGKITDVPAKASSNVKFKHLYPPTPTALTKLPMSQRTLILHSLLLLLLSLQSYSGPSRILLLHLTSSLKLPLRTLEVDESTTAKGLLEAAKELSADEETKKAAEQNKENRKWKVGLATAAGAAIIGVSGGLAAPLVAAGVGSVMSGVGLGATTAAAYLGSVAGSTLLVGGLFGAYGGRMSGQMMEKYAREISDFGFVPVHPDNAVPTSEDVSQGAKEASDHDHKLRVTICVSGWLTEKEGVVRPWRSLGTQGGSEVFALKYELEALLNLGNALNGVVQSAAWGYAQKELIAQTIFADLAAAMWPIGLLKVARVIDNPFSVAKDRSDKAGEVLADALINKAQGGRPVSLMGFSMGARVIYKCLEQLAKRKAFGLVESVVLIGAPVPSGSTEWRGVRSVVSGRLVNVYSENDYILGFMYRTSSVQYGVAGLQKVEGVKGVENWDVSKEASGHAKYRYLVGSILKKIGWEDVDMDVVEQEMAALKEMEEEEKKNSLQAKKDWVLRRESTGGKGGEAEEAEMEADDLEKKVKANTQKSLMTQAMEWWYTPGTKEAEKAVQDPGKTAGADAAGGVGGTNSYADWAAKKLPSMPGRTTGKTPGANTAGQGQIQGQSYTQYAASYLPKEMPNMPKKIPKLPTFGTRSNKPAAAAQKQTQANSVTEMASDAASGAQSAAGTAGNVAKETITPTVKNVLQPNKNPAVQATKDTAKNMPAAKQARENIPGAAATEELVGTTAGNALDKVGNVGEKVTEGGESAGETATDAGATAGKTAGDAAKTASDGAQSYTSYAASYLSKVPSMMGSRQGEKEEGTKKKPPKLDRARSSGLRSPAPRTERATSGVKSPLDRTDSGVSGKRQPPKLDRVSSGVKNAQKEVEDTGGQVVKKGGEGVQSVGSGAVDVGGQAVEKGKEGLGGIGKMAGLGGK